MSVSYEHLGVEGGLTAIATQHKLTYGLSRSPTRAARQKTAATLQSQFQFYVIRQYSLARNDIVSDWIEDDIQFIDLKIVREGTQE